MLDNLFSKKSTPEYSQEVIDMLRLIRSENVGVKTFSTLMELFGNVSISLENIGEFAKRGGRTKPIKICSEAEARAEIEKLHKSGGTLISYKDPKYSKLLLEIIDYPPILSFKGNIELLDSDKIVAIVGARNASINGKAFAKQIAIHLADNEYVTASGLARGIDTAVHSAAPQKTIAVIAGGIDNIYPPENAKLYDQIAAEGLILSEYPFGSKPLSGHFPMRNRIISGISAGVAVIEAGIKSGSLITANFALEHNRDVFAMPGFPLDPRSGGSNKLLKDGAYLLESAEDIIQNCTRYKKNKKSLADFATNDNNFRAHNTAGEIIVEDSHRILIIDLLSSTPVSLESVLQETNLPLPVIYTVCLELELAGKIVRHPGNRISLKY